MNASVLRHKLSNDFYLTVFARFALSFSVELQATLMGWQMYEFTNDPLQLGLVGLAEGLPALCLALFAGYLVDRGDPKKIYFGVLLISTLSLFLSWFAKNPSHLFLAAIMTGLVRSFASPALQTVFPRLVTKEKLKETNAWTTGAYKLATISGPAVGGTLLALKGKDAPYALAFFVLSLAILSFPKVKVPKAHLSPSTSASTGNSSVKKPSLLDEMLVGLKFVYREKFLFSSLCLDMFAVLFGGATAILPMFAKDVLDLGPQGLGILRASPAVGALIMSIILIRRPFIRQEGKTLFWVVFGFGVTTLLFALSRNVWLCSLFLGIGGALDSISMVIRGALVQTLSPDHMRGRIASVNSIFIGSSNEIGAFESGVAARVFGLIPSLHFGGVMTILTVLTVYRMTPYFYQFTLKKLTTPNLEKV
jgi:MFS family permease